MAQVLTANRLGDGRVVFLSADGSWSPRLDAARVANDESEEQALAALGAVAEGQCLVVGSYLVQIREKPGRPPTPVSFRERIRAQGPTVQTESS